MPYGEDMQLINDEWLVTVAPDYGLLIRDACERRSGLSALWGQPARLPELPSGALLAPGPESLETFWDIFAGGWFPMFPAAGFAGELDGRATMFHGELNRLRWDVVDHGPTWVEARVETVRAPFGVKRRIGVDGADLRVETVVENTGAAPASYMYGEHPCLSRETFAGGRLLLDAERAWVPAPSFTPAQAILVPGEEFAWPVAPGHGGRIDLSEIPVAPDGRRDHACVKLAASTIRVTSPRLDRELAIEVDLDMTPYLLLSFGYDDEWDMLAVEPISAPGRSVEDAVAAGCVRTLAPGERFSTAVVLGWK